MGKKSAKKNPPPESPGEATEETYSVGALSSIISSGSSSLPFESLFSTDKRQTSAEPEEKDSEEDSTKATDPETEEKEDEAEVVPKEDEAEVVPKEDEAEAVPKVDDSPSLKRKAQQEDAKEFILDPEKEKRTIFIGNLRVETKKKDLMRLFKDFGSIESVRFRGAARPDEKTLKKVTIIRNLNHESRDTFLAYIRFKELDAAKEALKLNGVEFNGKTLRVDSAFRSEVDQKKAVFVGNLDFSLTEEEVHSHFRVCGEISSVRLVRDKSTGMGKGFGYVNFESADGAQNALELHDSQLKGRKIRVNRSSNRPKNTVQKKLPKKAGAETSRSTAYKKVNKSYEKNSFQGVSAAGTEDEKPKKKGRNKTDRKKNIIAKKLMRN